MNPQVGRLGTNHIRRLGPAAVDSQLRRSGQVAVENAEVILRTVLRVQLEIIKSELDLLTVLREINKPNAIDINSVVGRKVRRR